MFSIINEEEGSLAYFLCPKFQKMVPKRIAEMKVKE